VGNLSGAFASWSPDGKQIVFGQGKNLYLANADGSSPHLVVSVTGLAAVPAFSPDGSRIRFTNWEQSLGRNAIWEVRPDGSHLHEVIPGWHNPPYECCGRWTADGRYYIFQTTVPSDSNIYALPDSTSIFRKKTLAPTQLTTGPLLYNNVLPDLAGRKIFVQGTQARGELVRFDSATKQFVPFLGGISAIDVAFSRDGKWVAYVTAPDYTLWRSRVDGSERQQLTYAPSAASLPAWSPDGSQIAYIASDTAKPSKVFIISSQGGTPEELLDENISEVDVSWSPDGSQLAMGRIGTSNSDAVDIKIAEVRARKISTVPGSQGLYSPRWSPDGRYLVAIDANGSTKLMLYDFRTSKWSTWMTETADINYPQWTTDSRYVYYANYAGSTPKFRRIRLGDNHPEDLIDLSGLRRLYSVWGAWSGIAPDNSALFTRDLSVQEIYGLDVDWP
jgi:Tol biopolymer transport system component